MFFIVICLLSSLLVQYVDSTYFDQRQVGDVNVQVDVNDVQIFAVMKGSKEEEYMDYDYTYDYSEFTIKPQNRTTPKPSKGTTSSTEPNNLKYNLTTALPIVQEPTIGPLTSDSTTLDPVTTTIHFESDNKTTESNTADIDITKKTVTTTTPISTKIKCKKGYFLNKKGDCQLQLNSTGNAFSNWSAARKSWLDRNIISLTKAKAANTAVCRAIRDIQKNIMLLMIAKTRPTLTKVKTEKGKQKK